MSDRWIDDRNERQRDDTRDKKALKSEMYREWLREGRKTVEKEKKGKEGQSVGINREIRNGGKEEGKNWGRRKDGGKSRVDQINEGEFRKNVGKKVRRAERKKVWMKEDEAM